MIVKINLEWRVASNGWFGCNNFIPSTSKQLMLSAKFADSFSSHPLLTRWQQTTMNSWAWDEKTYCVSKITYTCHIFRPEYCKFIKQHNKNPIRLWKHTSSAKSVCTPFTNHYTFSLLSLLVQLCHLIVPPHCITTLIVIILACQMTTPEPGLQNTLTSNQFSV